MKTKKTLSLLLALAMVFALCLTGCGDGGETITLNFSAHDPETSAIMVATQAYFDQVKEATDGAVEIKLLGSGVMASVSSVGDMVSAGGVDMGWIYTSYYPTMFTLSDVITLPLQGFGDSVAATQVLWDLYESVPEMAAQWDDEYKLLQLYANPPMIFESKTPITSVEDVKGMSIRCPSGAITDVLTAWGATPVMLGTPDIYESMQKNNIDGYLFEVVGTTTFSLQEVTNYYLDMPLFTGPFGVVMNWDSWNKLPAEYQEIIDSLSGRQASLDSATAFVAAMDAATELIKTSNGSNGEPGQFITPTEEEIAGWQVAADEYAAKWCQNITDSTGIDGAAYLAKAQEMLTQYQ